VKLTARRTFPIDSVFPCQPVSTNPGSSVSTTMFGRNRYGSNRLAGASSVSRRVLLVVTTWMAPKLKNSP